CRVFSPPRKLNDTRIVTATIRLTMHLASPPPWTSTKIVPVEVGLWRSVSFRPVLPPNWSFCLSLWRISNTGAGSAYCAQPRCAGRFLKNKRRDDRPPAKAPSPDRLTASRPRSLRHFRARSRHTCLGRPERSAPASNESSSAETKSPGLLPLTPVHSPYLYGAAATTPASENAGRAVFVGLTRRSADRCALNQANATQSAGFGGC